MKPMPQIFSSLVLVGCFLIAGPSALLAQQKAAPLPHERPELGLTQEQKDQIQQIRETQRQKLRAVRSDSALSPQERRTKAHELRKETRAKVDAVLTPEQRTKLAQFRKEYRDHHRARKPGNGPGRSGSPDNL